MAICNWRKAQSESLNLWRFIIGGNEMINDRSSPTRRRVNVYCPEWPPGGTIGHPGGQQKKFLPFGHGRDLVAFNGTSL